MNSFFKSIILIFGTAILLTACDGQYDSLVNSELEENPPPEPTTGEPGNADFSNYIALGNSLTAGFMDAALYNLGQENSLPALIASQLVYAGAPESFNQPDINSESGFNTIVAQPQNGPVLGRFKLDTSIPGPSPVINGELLENTPFNGDPGSLDNFGVPGTVVGQLLTPDTGNPSHPAFNPFYARFATAPGTSTIIGDALATSPSFFTLWIGTNDVLGYALGGASNPALLTSPQAFNTQYNAVVDQMIKNSSAKGVVATIPLVTLTPFFRAITWDNITLDAATAQQLNAGLQGVNSALDGVAQFPDHTQDEVDERKVNYQEGNNPILVRDPDLEDFGDEFDQLQALGAITAQQRGALVPYEQSRPLTSNELVTLTAGSVLGTDADPQSPLPTTIGVVIPLGFNIQNPGNSTGDEFFLSTEELDEIQSRIVQFNTTIATTVLQNNSRLALYDINSGFPGNPNTEIGALADLFGIDGELGIRVNGTLLNPDFSPNGVFSTDGVHTNPRGNAILANEIIRTIEQSFGAIIPKVDVLSLPSVQLCANDCLNQQSKLVFKEE